MADLLELSSEIRAIELHGAAGARGSGEASGRLRELGEWVAGATGRRPVRLSRVRLVHFAELSGGVADLADAAEIGTRFLDPGADTSAAADIGIAAADDEVDSGAELLLLAEPGTGPAAAVAVSLIAGAEPVALLPRGAAAVDSASWVAAAVALRDLRRIAAPARNRAPALLAALDSPALSAATGFVLRCAARRTPMVLDGAGAAAAALVAFLLRPRAAQWWQVADTGGDAVTASAVAHIGQRPVLDVGGRPGTGVAALLALSILQAAVKLHTVEGGDE